MKTTVHLLWGRIRHHWQRFRVDEDGYSTEAVVVTAVLVAAAIAVLAIIVAKVIAKANGISL